MRFVFDKQLGELLFQSFYLGAIADEDVRIVGVVVREVLVVILGAVEAFERRHFCDDRLRKCIRGTELRDICSRDALLVVIHVEDCGAVGRADVGSLPVELRGVVNRKEDAEKLAVGDLLGIVDHFY